MWEYLTRWILLTSSIVNTASGLPSELTSIESFLGAGCFIFFGIIFGIFLCCCSTAPIYAEGVLLPHLEMEIWHFRRAYGGITKPAVQILFLSGPSVKLLSRVRLFATLWTEAYQAPPSMGFSRQEYWSGLPFTSPGDLPDPGKIIPGKSRVS